MKTAVVLEAGCVMKGEAANWLKDNKNLIVSLAGIRGTLPAGLDAGRSLYFTRAFAHGIGRRIVIGRDTRYSGLFLSHIVIGALLEAGKEVIDLGIVPTPTLKCAVKLYKAAGGIMITASHNPMEWNGFKYFREDGFFFSQTQYQSWQRALSIRQSAALRVKQAGSYHQVQDYRGHIDAILDFLGPDHVQSIAQKKYRVVVDGGNGAGAGALPSLLAALGCECICLHCEAKECARFPRPPEPQAHALAGLGALLKKHKGAVGFALDPDADRLSLASPRRGAVSEEYSLPLAFMGLQSYIQNTSGAKSFYGNRKYIVVNFSTSLLCEDLAAQYQAQVLRAPVGEAHVVAMMRKKRAFFGGEGNGGVILPAVASYGRDALSGAALVLHAMAQRHISTIDELLDELPVIYMKKSKHSLPAAGKLSCSAAIRKIYTQFVEHFPAAQAHYQDGLYLSLPDRSRLHLRPSNTEQILRLVIEAADAKMLASIYKFARGILGPAYGS